MYSVERLFSSPFSLPKFSRRAGRASPFRGSAHPAGWLPSDSPAPTRYFLLFFFFPGKWETFLLGWFARTPPGTPVLNGEGLRPLPGRRERRSGRARCGDSGGGRHRGSCLPARHGRAAPRVGSDRDLMKTRKNIIDGFFLGVEDARCFRLIRQAKSLLKIKQIGQPLLIRT